MCSLIVSVYSIKVIYNIKIFKTQYVQYDKQAKHSKALAYILLKLLIAFNVFTNSR